MKRFLLALLALLIVIPATNVDAVAYDPPLSYESLNVRFWEDQAPPIGFYINSASRYILETVPEPRMGSTYGEWSVMDLLRGIYTGYDYINHITPAYFDDYLERINRYVISKEGNLDRNKSTEWSRLTLSLSALGKDIRAVGQPGEYLKTTTARQKGDDWVIETTNLASQSSLKINNNTVLIEQPVGIQTEARSYELLQPGKFTVNKANEHVSLTNGNASFKIASDQLVTLAEPYNFVQRMSQSHRFSYRQGINGPIWVIIAMNTGQYDLIPEAELVKEGITIANNDNANTVGQMIDYILAREITTTQNEVGGWALTGNKPDADITGMALQAFAPYYLDAQKFKTTNSQATYEEFKKAVERGIVTLKRLQKANGGFDSWGTINSESTVQVIVALTAMHMDPQKKIELPTIQQTVDFHTEGAFVDGVWTNNMIDALLTFYAPATGSSPEIGGFKHVTSGYDGGGGSGTTVNAMATDQALYGLIAYDRFLKGENSLYDMTDMINGEYKGMKATTYKVTFVDGKNETVVHYSPFAKIELPASAKTWNTKSSLNGTRYKASEFLIMPEHDITLYADHNPNEVDTAAVQKVIQYIDALPKLKDITKDYKNQIDRAKQAYNKLTEAAQSLVTNYAYLLQLDAKVNGELSQYDNELKVSNLIQTIDSLIAVPNITRDYENAITNARIAYNNLTAKQRMDITNREQLDVLEARLAISIEMEDGQQHTLAMIQQAIERLPSLNTVSLADASAIFRADALVKQLSAQQQGTLQNTKQLAKLIEQIRALQLKYLQQEQLEDELNDDSYGQLAVIGETLHVTAPRTTGTFQVRIHTSTLLEALTAEVEEIIFSDIRGVTLHVSKQSLLQQIKDAQGELILQVSQLDYETKQFHIEWRLSTGETLISPTYMKLTIPYDYFVNGRNLNKLQLAKVQDELVATPHVMKTKEMIVHLFNGNTYEFMDNQFTFKDTQVTNRENIEYLANRLVVNGIGANQFGPEQTLTRAQFAVMVNRALNFEASKQTAFADIQGGWYEKDIQALYEKGIIKGVSDTKFNPNGHLTREQVAVMMTRILDYIAYPTAHLKTGAAYQDHHQISSYAKDSALILKNLNIMSGVNNTFAPQQPLTRSQMAKILKRTLEVAQLM